MFLLSKPSKTNLFSHPTYLFSIHNHNHHYTQQLHNLNIFSEPKCPILHSLGQPRVHFPACPTSALKSASSVSKESEDYSVPVSVGCNSISDAGFNDKGIEKTSNNNFWGAVSLIIGTAVGPGMLGLPAATIKSGPIRSSIIIFLSWIYVISSIILVGELSFATMEEDGVEEVSFTGLATKAFGNGFDAFVGVVYASLSFALLVACVSGIGSIVSQWFPRMNHVMANVVFPLAVGVVMGLSSFKGVDVLNRFLCFLMLFSITALVGIGFSAARSNLVSSLGATLFSSWKFSLILPAIPVIVLTFGFHVITPFICKLAGNKTEARKAILIGGFVPLAMVLSWNLIVLGLADSGTGSAVASKNPISLLLSVSSSASPAVQGFAFSALATSFIGYAVSLPKQIFDTIDLIFKRKASKGHICPSSRSNHGGRVGFVTYSGLSNPTGNAGRVLYNGIGYAGTSEAQHVARTNVFDPYKILVTMLILSLPVLLASYFQSSFSRALDFAGVYANCFLFGILPPVMTFIYQYNKKLRSPILPGGNITLLILFSIAVILAIWH